MDIALQECSLIIRELGFLRLDERVSIIKRMMYSQIILDGENAGNLAPRRREHRVRTLSSTASLCLPITTIRANTFVPLIYLAISGSPIRDN